MGARSRTIITGSTISGTAKTAPAAIKILAAICALALTLLSLPDNAAAASLPSVNTLPPQTIRTDSAILRGVVNNDGGSPILERGIIYSMTPNPVLSGTAVKVPGTTGNYKYKITGLMPGTRYYYVAYARNSFGISYGNTRNFLTLGDAVPPVITEAMLEGNNAYIDVYMSEPVYGTGRTALTAASFRWEFISNNGSAQSATISDIKSTDGLPLAGGETAVRFYLSIDGIPSGVETIQIWAATGSSVFDSSGNAMLQTETTGAIYLNDRDSPKILASSLAADNAYIDVIFSNGIYADGMVPVNMSLFKLFFARNGGDASNAAVTSITNIDNGILTGGETEVRFKLSVTGVPSGDEYIIISPAGSYLIFDDAGNAMSADQTTGPKYLNDLTLPAIQAAVLSADNSYIDITFTKGVYNIDLGPLYISLLKLYYSVNGGTAQKVEITGISGIGGSPLSGGELSVRVYISVTGIPSGVETVEIRPVSSYSVFDESGNAMAGTQTTGALRLFDTGKPLITGSYLAPDNSYMDIYFSEGIYGKTPEGNRTAVSLTDFTLYWQRNGGGTYSISVSELGGTGGLALAGGETAVRAYLLIAGTPTGEEEILVGPAGETAVADAAGNYMDIVQNTGWIRLYAQMPVKSLRHSVKAANGRIAGMPDITFLPGDYVPLSVIAEFRADIADPVLAVDLSGDNTDFCLAVITGGDGLPDSRAAVALENGNVIAGGIVEITLRDAGNTLLIGINASFSAGDTLEIIYYTRLCVDAGLTGEGSLPVYGAMAYYSCRLEWGEPLMVYSEGSQYASGDDIFSAGIKVAAPWVLR